MRYTMTSVYPITASMVLLASMVLEHLTVFVPMDLVGKIARSIVELKIQKFVNILQPVL